MTSRVQFTLSNEPTEEIEEFLNSKLKEFNDRTCVHFLEARKEGRRPLSIVIRNDNGNIIGGLVGSTYWNWFDVKLLWIAEDFRGRGLGRDLLQRAENNARSRGCAHAKLSTFSFQAQDFYEKLGYKVVGQMSDYPPGESFYWMRKDL